MTDLRDEIEIIIGAAVVEATGRNQFLAAPVREAANVILHTVLEEAARVVDCGCPSKAEVLAVSPNSGARWRACGMTNCSALEAAAIRALAAAPAPPRRFALGDRVRKVRGSSWQGRVVGFYATVLTPVGYAVESEREPGSVQIYPEAALEPAPPQEAAHDRD